MREYFVRHLNLMTLGARPLFRSMVEMMGIEPMSESISPGLSPSEAFVLGLRLNMRPKAGSWIGYPVSPLCGRDHA